MAPADAVIDMFFGKARSCPFEVFASTHVHHALHVEQKPGSKAAKAR